MTVSAEFDAVLSVQRRVWRKSMMTMAVLAIVLAGCCHYAGLFDAELLADGIPSLVTLVTEMFPPDFSQLKNWIGPLTDTLAMSVAGTAIAVILSVPLGVLAARNTSPNPVVFHLCRGLWESCSWRRSGSARCRECWRWHFIPSVWWPSFSPNPSNMSIRRRYRRRRRPDAAPCRSSSTASSLRFSRKWPIPPFIAGNTTSVLLPSWGWSRTDRLVADYAVSGSIGHFDRDFADGDDRRCFQFMAAQENTIIEGKK